MFYIKYYIILPKAILIDIKDNVNIYRYIFNVFENEYIEGTL